MNTLHRSQHTLVGRVCETMPAPLTFCSRAKAAQEAQALPAPVRHPVNKQLLLIRESMDECGTVKQKTLKDQCQRMCV